MGIGQLRCAVIDVDDLAVAEAFWSELTGLPVIGSAWTGRFSYLGQPDPWRHELILQRATRPKGEEPNRVHVDIWVRDIDDAIARVEALGGTRKHGPRIYPRPGEFPDEDPLLDWAVMRDPFGNEFCLVNVLTPHQAAAVIAAAGTTDGSDAGWRAAAHDPGEDRHHGDTYRGPAGGTRAG